MTRTIEHENDQKASSILDSALVKLGLRMTKMMMMMMMMMMTMTMMTAHLDLVPEEPHVQPGQVLGVEEPLLDDALHHLELGVHHARVPAPYSVNDLKAVL